MSRAPGRPPSTSVLLLASTVFLLSCGGAGDEGLVRAPRLEVPDCDGHAENAVFEPFEMQLNFFALTRFEDDVRLRMQADGRLIPETDGALIEIPGADALEREVAEKGEAERPLGRARDTVRAVLFFHERCAGRSAPLMLLNGTIRLDLFEVEVGGQVRGRVRGDVTDVRTGAVVGPGMTLDFDFSVRVGSPYQPFTPF